MRLLGSIAAGAMALVMAGGGVAAYAAERAIIILDGSGSMWAQIDGEARISIARETLGEVLDRVPADLELGFMTYGHRAKGECSDIELLVEPQAGTADAIRKAAAGITPLGKTPISDAVRLAAEDLRYTEDKATVILITDGIESCEADPCALASELERSGIDFTTHVVGFGLSDEEGAAVSCLAENTGGKYFKATDGKELADALASTVIEVAKAPEPAPEPAAPEFNFDPSVIVVEGGAPLTEDDGSPTWEIHKAAGGEKGEYVTMDYGTGFRTSLEPGDYIVTAKVDWATVQMPVTITAGEVAEPVFNVNGGRLTVRPFAAEGEPVDSGARVDFTFPDGYTTTYYGETRLWVPAGDTKVVVSVGEGSTSETVSVPAGEKVERDIVVGVGHAVFNAFYVEGMRVEEGGLTINVVGAKKDIQGNREDIGTSYGPDTTFALPPGDYVARISLQAAQQEVPFTVASGAAINVDAQLNAGVLVIAAPGSDFVEVFEAKKDIQGNRKSLAYGYGGELQVTIGAGDYVVAVEPKDGSAKKEATATVTAGERTELTIE